MRVFCDGRYVVGVLYDVWYVVKFYVMGGLWWELYVMGGMC